MVNEEQAERLKRLKALLDSGAITQVEFETAKRSILAEGSVSAAEPIESVPPKRLRLFGILGLVALVIPWNVIFWHYYEFTGTSIRWHLFTLSFLGSDLTNINYIMNFSSIYLVLVLIGFILALTGSILLLMRKKLGGALLVGSLILWVITYVHDIAFGLFNPNIPVGALMCGIVGALALLQKKKVMS